MTTLYTPYRLQCQECARFNLSAMSPVYTTEMRDRLRKAEALAAKRKESQRLGRKPPLFPDTKSGKDGSSKIANIRRRLGRKPPPFPYTTSGKDGAPVRATPAEKDGPRGRLPVPVDQQDNRPVPA
jgi:hypothetical protein